MYILLLKKYNIIDLVFLTWIRATTLTFWLYLSLVLAFLMSLIDHCRRRQNYIAAISTPKSTVHGRHHFCISDQATAATIGKISLPSILPAKNHQHLVLHSPSRATNKFIQVSIKKIIEGDEIWSLTGLP